MTEPLWRASALAEAMAAHARGELPDAVTGVSIDSRTVGRGEAFFAIKGDRFDGHDFVRAALDGGAAVAVVDAAHAGALDGSGPLLVVDDVLDGLRAAGRAARARTDARIVAVTGSVGKTGTKEMLRLALGALGSTHGSAASFNNHWGVPLTLARMPAQSRFAVFEIGMNHAGEITPLTAMVRPHVAIVTTVEPVHLAQFPSVEAIADAKAEIFDGVEPGGAAVLNRDNPHFDRLAAAARARGARIVSFGTRPGCEVRLDRFTPEAAGSVIEATILGQALTYRLGAPGRHLAQNSLAALAAVVLLGGDLPLAAEALAAFRAPVGRGERHDLTTANGPALLIDESYNANPASMRAALQLLADAPVGPAGRRIAVLGDMLELGPQGESLHAGLRDAALEAKVDLLFAAGPLMRGLFEAMPARTRGGWAETSAEIEPLVLDALGAGDVVMVKGSLGSRMGPIAKALKARFAPQLAPAAGE